MVGVEMCPYWYGLFCLCIKTNRFGSVGRVSDCGAEVRWFESPVASNKRSMFDALLSIPDRVIEPFNKENVFQRVCETHSLSGRV